MDLSNIEWHKSTYSGADGNCVELASLPSNLTWRKASWSGQDGGNGVELAELPSNDVWRKASQSGSNAAEWVELAGVVGALAVRDSKNPDGPVLLLSRAALRTAVQVQCASTGNVSS